MVSKWKAQRDEQVLANIDAIGEFLSLPEEIVKYAKEIYYKITEKNLLRTIHSDVCPPATIYASAVKNKRPIAWRELEEITQIPAKRIRRAYRKLLSDVIEEKIQLTTLDWIQFIIEKLKLGELTKNTAIEIERITRNRVNGASKGIAASCVYLASIIAEERITQKQISEVAKVSEATIRSRAREMRKIIFP